jgi:hypothetical protein
MRMAPPFGGSALVGRLRFNAPLRAIVSDSCGGTDGARDSTPRHAGLPGGFDIRFRRIADWSTVSRCGPARFPDVQLEVTNMSKSHDTKKDKKKPAQKSPKEKRQEKREKKRQ